MDDKWYDPPHGIIPEKYQPWYEKNSGAFFRDGRWYVDTDDRKVINHTCEKDGRSFGESYKRGDVIQLEMLKAAALQECILDMNKLIIGHMGKKGSYIISRENIFDLIIHGQTELTYKKEGREYKEKMRAPKQEKTVAAQVFDPLYE